MFELARKGSNRSDDETDFLVVLSRLIRDYEENMPEVQEMMRRVQKISPAKIIQSLMDDHGLSQTQLAREADIDQGNLSAFLSGHRKLSPMTALKLAKRFKLSPDSWLSAVTKGGAKRMRDPRSIFLIDEKKSLEKASREIYDEFEPSIKKATRKL